LIKDCLLNSIAWSTRAFLKLPACNTELELLCKEVLNPDIKEGRLMAFWKCQCTSDVFTRRPGTRPKSKFWCAIKTSLVLAGPVNGWKVSL